MKIVLILVLALVPFVALAGPAPIIITSDDITNGVRDFGVTDDTTEDSLSDDDSLVDEDEPTEEGSSCNQGLGDGAEGCDPGNSAQNGSNDECAACGPGNK